MADQNEREQQETELLETIASFTHDPLGFVLFAFDWGVGELEAFPDGPDDWQREILDQIGKQLRAGAITVTEAINIAIASGHGIGKSALVAWIILWAICTHEDTKGVVTANTENQLKTKTWAELAKWYRMCICAHWFEHTATAIFSRTPGHEKTWRIDMVPWSERNTEAFAGLHNQGKRILIVFDEGSGIPDVIYDVTEGALTDENTEIIWCVFGNPTRNTGKFRDFFGKLKHRWFTRQIDSRTVKMTNKIQIQKWVDDYGEDSDFVRVRVRGVFPATGVDNLLGPDHYAAAIRRHYTVDQYAYAAKILGVDVARQGDDKSVIFPRQGLVAFKPKVMVQLTSIPVALEVARAFDKWGADAIFVDGTGGYGAGVIDQLNSMGYPVHEIHFAGKAIDPRYFNKRSEMAFLMAEWIKKGGAIPDFPDLEEELCHLPYKFSSDKFRLLDKEQIKVEIGRSPDLVDALGLTFAFPIQPPSPAERLRKELGLDQEDKRGGLAHEYDGYAN